MNNDGLDLSHMQPGLTAPTDDEWKARLKDVAEAVAGREEPKYALTDGIMFGVGGVDVEGNHVPMEELLADPHAAEIIAARADAPPPTDDEIEAEKKRADDMMFGGHVEVDGRHFPMYKVRLVPDPTGFRLELDGVRDATAFQYCVPPETTVEEHTKQLEALFERAATRAPGVRVKLPKDSRATFAKVARELAGAAEGRPAPPPKPPGNRKARRAAEARARRAR